MSGDTRHQQTGYGQLIRTNSNFRALWFGQIASLLGDWFNFIASVALLAHLSQSGLAVGTLFVVRMLAPFLVSPAAGVIADIYDRKRILLLTDLSRAILVLGFLFIREPADIWLLYVLTTAQLAISGFFYPARISLLPRVVVANDIGTANALSSATWSVMLALGAALGGLVSGSLGIYPAFIVDSLTFLISAFFILRVQLPGDKGRSSSRPSTHSGLHLYREGITYLGRHGRILAISLHKASIALFASLGFQVVQVGIAEDIFPMGQAGGISLGLMFAVAGVGTGAGPILARRYTGDRSNSLCRAILLGYLICALGLFIIAPLWSFSLVLVGILLRGIGGGIVWVFSSQLLLQLLPDHVLGRILGIEFAIFTLAGALGAMGGGWAVDSLGLSGTTWVLGLLTLLPMKLWFLWLSREQFIKGGSA